MAIGHLTLARAFATFGARLANYNWAISAIAEDGALVYSCWNELLKQSGGLLRYTDRLSRWRSNVQGNQLAHEHLTSAFHDNRPVRLVVAMTKDPGLLTAGAKTRGQTKWSVRKDVEGRVISFDGDKFVIDFR